MRAIDNGQVGCYCCCCCCWRCCCCGGCRWRCRGGLQAFLSIIINARHNVPALASKLAVLSFMRRSISSIDDNLSASRSTSSCGLGSDADGPAAPPCRGCCHTRAAATNERGVRPGTRFGEFLGGALRTWEAVVALGCFLGFGGRMKSSGCSNTCLFGSNPQRSTVDLSSCHNGRAAVRSQQCEKQPQASRGVHAHRS